MSYPPPPPTGPDDSGSTPPPPSAPPPPPPYGSPPPPYGSQPPAYPPGGGYAGGYGAAVPANNQKALWAMILGILGIICCPIASVVALVLGMQSKKEIASSGGAQTGAGQAQAGFVLGIIGCALWALIIVGYAGLAVTSFSTT